MNDSKHQSKEEEIAEIQRHARQHIIMAFGLAAATGLTIWTSLQPGISPAVKIAIAMAIACSQGFLILAFFMNLMTEKKMIFSVLIITFLFFFVQMGVTVWARLPMNEIHLQIK
jgi:heme/copper-type cytochrome/quinol oxidase subunit 4